ncbi:MAG TPA: SDR family NAD(P)-dependent oxidoreductase, partial [Herpetosiphonaceae bacterium]
RGQGTVGGDGVGVVVLKRLEDALADGDTIHAVIAGFGINNDGTAKAGYTAPSVQGQAQAIEAAHALAEINPETINYIEAHGTATTLGDPIEIEALTMAFRAKTDKVGFCAIGSVKTNIGHLNTAAGVAGLIKTVLALKHKRIPPSLHFQQPNLAIDFAASPFYVNTRLAAWRTGSTPRRAGVSSFGVGGTNAHVVLEEAPAAEPTSPARPWQLLLLSAKTESALETATGNLAAYLEQHPNAELADIAYTLQVGRRAFEHRRAILCRDVAGARQALASRDPSLVWTQSAGTQEPQIVFMFPGQGAQYLQMAAGLYTSEPVFRAHVDRCAELLQPRLGFDLRQVIYPDAEHMAAAAAQIQRPGVVLPALFVIEYALALNWQGWGIQPQALIGHSFGEYVAATLAGVFSLEDALALAVVRGQLMDQLAAGAMLSVALPAAEIGSRLGPLLSLAAINGPALCVVSGPVAAIAELEAALKAENVDCRRLHADAAPHSALVEPMLEPFTAFVSSLELAPPKIPYLSNLTGTWITPEQATDPRYWARHLRETVRFADGLQPLLDNPDMILLEVGPGRTLATLAKLQAAPERIVLTSSRHPYDQTPDEACALTALAEIWLAGGRVNWQWLYANERRQRIPLPTYPFERQRYWIDAIPGAAQIPGGSLRKKPDLADWFYLPSWKRSLRPQRADSHAEIWLIFADDSGITAQLSRRLRDRGQEVVEVHAGDAWARLDATSYTIAPDRPDDYRTLLDALHAQGTPPTRIVHLWNVAAHSPASAEITAFYSLLWLAQALGTQPTQPIQLRVISQAMQAVAGEAHLIPEKALLLGPCQVIPEEYPHISCQSIDILVPAAANGSQTLLIEQLLAELATPIADPVIAYRGRDRWVRAFEAARLEPGDNHSTLRSQGVYLITGGLGGMGLQLAEHLARSVQARLVLVGRSALPARDRWQEWLATHADDDRTSARIRAVLALEAHGSEVMLCSADVSDAAQMRAVIAETLSRFGALHGIIHAAGIPGGGLIQLKTQVAAEEVLAAKVAGTRALVSAIADLPLDFLVLCSSLSSLIGGFGRVDYCAVNAFLDAFAHAAALPTRIVTINWDAWQSVGMAAEAVQADATLDGEQLRAAIRPDEGVAVFERILAESSLSQIIVSTRDLAARAGQMRRAAQDLAALTTIQPAGVKHARGQRQAPYVAPRSQLEAQIAAIWQRVLGIELVGVDDNFFALGGHSLLAVQLLGQLQREMPGDALSLQTIFAAPTVAALAATIERDRQAEQPQAAQPDLLALLPRIGDSGEAELSFAQQRLWFIDQLAPGISAYNLPVAVRLSGDLHLDALQQSLSALIQRHAILRTTFRLIEDQPRQVIAPVEQHASVTLKLIDLLAVQPDQREAQAQQLATAEVQQPFDLQQGPLLRATLLRTDDSEHLLLLTMHHIISDAWSIGILLRELTTLYRAFADHKTPDLPALPFQYADFASWQRQWLSGDVLDRQLSYWRAQLADIQPLELPTDYPRPAVATYSGANQLFSLSPRLSADLKALSQHEGCTLFMLLLAGFQTLLHRYSGQSDIAVSTAVANRGRSEFDDLIGCFINILVLRADLRGNPDFRALLHQVREICQSAYAHQDLPFELLVDQLAVERDLSRNPLSQVMLIVHNTPREPIELDTLSIRPVALSERMSAEFDLTIHIWEHNGELHGQLTYNTDLFAAAAITRLIEHFQTLLAGIVAQQDRRISDLPLLTAAERRLLLQDWNATQVDYGQDRCLHELIEEQARRTPDAIAVTFEAAQLTYAELNARSNRLARYLRALGVTLESRVAIFMERSLELPVALLAVLKAGAAYVPIDPGYPEERIQFMLADAQTPVVLTQQRLRERLPDTDAQILALDLDDCFQERDESVDSGVTPDNIAYIIYTSGSTGRPKGAMIPHRGLVNYLHWCAQAYGIAEGAGVPVHSSLGFDLTVTSLFAPLIVGQRVILLPEDQGLDRLSAVLHSGADLSLVKLTPAHVDLLNYVLPGESLAGCMRMMIIGGEALRAETIAGWREHAPRTRIINEYGPTETVVGCCVYEVPP